MLRRLTFMALVICLCASPALAAPLHDAALKGDVAQIKTLLQGGADANEKNRLGMTRFFMRRSRGALRGSKLWPRAGRMRTGETR